MKKILLAFLLTFTTPTFAQDGTNHAIPVFGGPGFSGFREALPCAGGVLSWASAIVDPTCTSSPSFGGVITATGLIINTTPSTLNKAIVTTQSASGTTATNCTGLSFSFPCVNSFVISSDNVDATVGVNLDGWLFSHSFGGATLKGNRQVLDAQAYFTAPSGNAGVGNYVAGVFETTVQSGDGGSGVTSGTARGSFFGANPVVRTTAGATNLYSVVGMEIDINHSGSTFIRKGLDIVSFPGGALGASVDTALSIGAASGAGATAWGNGILISSVNGLQPIGSGGCAFCADTTIGGSYTISKGIDFSNITISTAFLKSVGFQVDGSGNVVGNSVAITGTTAPTIGMATPAANTVSLYTRGAESFRVNSSATPANFVSMVATAAGGSPAISVQGSDTDISMVFTSKGVSPVGFFTNAFNQQQFAINHTASANRFLQVTGSNGGLPTMSSTAGGITLAPNDGRLNLSGGTPTASACAGFALSAGSSTAAGRVTYTSATTCVINLGPTFTNAPFCNVTPGSAASTLFITTSTTQLSVTFGTAQTAFFYNCFGA